jgi:hypothetical protein
MLCPQRNLSDIVPSIEVFWQKFENPKSSLLVKFIDSNTFLNEGNEKFIKIKGVQWDESYRRVFYGSSTDRLGKTEISQNIKKKQKNLFSWIVK